MNPAKANSINNARLLLRQSDVGVLSTHSKANEGYPFGSVSTFMSTQENDVVFYISDLAQHTKNINNNPKMCFTVFTAEQSGSSNIAEDANAGARLSLMGDAEILKGDTLGDLSERFFSLFPSSREYQGTHDFAFYKLRCERARFIGGFGDIHWISADEWRFSTPDWLANESSMISHMNQDHADAMQLICNHYAGVATQQVTMLAINPDGAYYQCDDHKPIFIGFEEPAFTGTEIRKALVAQTNTARQTGSQAQAS